MKEGGVKQYILGVSPDVYAYAGPAGKHANPTGVTVKADPLTIGLGKSASVKAKVDPAPKGKRLISKVSKVRYCSSDTAVATVTKSGKVNAVGKGSCTIYALANNGVYATVMVTVDMSPTKVSFTGRTKTVGIETELDLSGFVKLTPQNAETELTWSSSDEAVATVDQYGVVTGHKAGKATIYATAANGKQAKVTVKVK